jgi:hypothetical protein
MVDSSANSPRRMLFLSRERAFVSILDDEKEGRFALSNKQGAKLLEVYGFVGSISTIVAAGEPTCLEILLKRIYESLI